jgi:hypothetical protein
MRKAVSGQWHLLAKDSLAAVYAERKLYMRPGSPHFYVHVRVANLSGRTIGVEPGRYGLVPHANQWGMQHTTGQGPVNESVIVPEKLDAKRIARIKDGFARGTLVRVRAGGSTDYYHDFNAGGGPTQKQERENEFFLARMSGQLFVTDGNRIQTLNCDEGRTAVQREMFIATPVARGTVPAGALHYSEEHR